jgi:hypothetical protein
MKKRCEAKGMRGKALRLFKDYLFKRFLLVVINGKSSTTREIFSGVPQGAKWSPKEWNLDISEMHCGLVGQLFCYADDSGIWYPVTDENRSSIIDTINDDLQKLRLWGIENKTTFEPEKNCMMVISNKRVPFDPTGIVFDERRPDMIGVAGIPVKQVKSLKLVGFLFDCKLTWGPMIDAIAKKARIRLGALRRLRPLLNDSNMKTMYIMFVRSIMEYGSAQFQGAAESHLVKLDRIQESAMKLGNFMIEPLKHRREAATASLVFKLLDGRGRGELNRFTPTLNVVTKGRFPSRTCSISQPKCGIRLEDRTNTYSLDAYKRSIAGASSAVWDKLPQSLIMEGLDKGYHKIEKRAKNLLLGKASEPIRNRTPSCSPVRLPSPALPDAPTKPRFKFQKPKSTPNLWEQLSHYSLPNQTLRSKSKKSKVLSDSFMIASGHYFENGEWHSHDQTKQ